MPAVSCIIPTRDRKEMTIQAVRSVLAQEGAGPLEIVVVDDGSKDGTGQEIRSLFPEVQLITTDGIGPGPARNAGAEASSGEILMFLDSDDLWHQEHVNILSGALDRAPAAFCITQNIDMATGTLFEVPDPDLCRKIEEGRGLELLFKWCYLMPSSFAVRKEAFLETGGFPDHARGLSIGEDWLFFIALASRFPIEFVPKIATTRRLHEGSLCSVMCSPEALKGLIGRIVELARGLPKEEADLRRRLLSWLDGHMALVTEEASRWQSVQDWFCALREKGLL
jgi:glycosyltransferase involved in cell wall biosynthesis